MERMTECPFCGPAAEEMVLQGRLWYARWDRYPVFLSLRTESGHDRTKN